MSERYKKLFSSPENLYAESSPVIISAGALLKDNQSGNVLAQLKFQNITPKKIKALTVGIQPMDTVGNFLGESVTYQYLDLYAERDSEFGQKTPITLPNAASRSFVVSVTEVIFTDNTTWAWENQPWEPLEKVQLLSALCDSELEKQFCLEYGQRCTNLLLDQKDLWHCVCGSINWKDEVKCHRCKKIHADLRAIDIDSLQTKKAERIAKEKIEAEAARKKAEAFKKNIIRIGAVAVCITIVVTIIMSVTDMNEYNSAVTLMESGQYEEAIAVFEALRDYKDSATQISECRYRSALSLMESGQYEEAIAAFADLGDYKDSAKRINSAYVKYKYAKLKNAKVGDYVVFGSYEQDNNTYNGTEQIEWLVLEKTENRSLLISKYALDSKPYNITDTDATWETCSLRQWLNGSFIYSAFSTEELAMIPTVTVSADKNPYKSTNPGNATQDKVFLLSMNEVYNYLGHSANERISNLTAYAIAQGAAKTSCTETYWWWLRSPGGSQSLATSACTDGIVNAVGSRVNRSDGAVRPAIWIQFE